MTDDGRGQEKSKSDEPQTGKFHYNPGNMAGEKAGIVEEIEKKQEQEEGQEQEEEHQTDQQRRRDERGRDGT
jgi:hypothetical protein